MEGTSSFEKTIEDYLRKRAFNNVLFAKKLENPNKSVSDCVTYILNIVKDSGKSGFTDDEIFNMAFHYYSESSVKTTKSRPSVTIVSNHQIKLSAEEVKELREKAKQEVIDEEKAKMRKKPTKKVEVKKEEDNGIKTLF